MNTNIRFLALFTVMLLVLPLLPPGPAHAGQAVAAPFREYYQQHDGMRVLGYPLTELLEADGFPAQYFEKGRLEDHHAEAPAPGWEFMYGCLVSELIAHPSSRFVNATNITYGQLKVAAAPRLRRQPPADFTTGAMDAPGGVFVPFDSQLRAAPGYIVAPAFWAYINRTDLFPDGWLHDIGLPITGAFPVKTQKQGQRRQILMQAFERTVLTLDVLNQPDWQVERGNIGADATPQLPPANVIDVPAPGQRVTLPLHILARVARPGDQVAAVLRWENGVELWRAGRVLAGQDGRGVLIDNLDLPPEQRSTWPWTQAATLEIRDAYGRVLAWQTVTVLSPDDPDTQAIRLYWIVDDRLRAETRRIPKTNAIEAAALAELLWGPSPQNTSGFTTALPLPEEVLQYSGRTAEWGARVALRKLRIADGVARADFSRELWAYGDRSMRASLIHGQITKTLLRFPTVREVRITIEGAGAGALEP
jgi:hypothetical protein